jgi:hypothetical protein
MDAHWYAGESAGARVGGAARGAHRAHRHLCRSFRRDQLPLKLASATTVHVSQGRTAHQHVMTPATRAFGGEMGFMRALTLSRSTTLEGLFLLRALTSAHFTAFRDEVLLIDAEYERLRALQRRQCHGDAPPRAATTPTQTATRRWTAIAREIATATSSRVGAHKKSPPHLVSRRCRSSPAAPAQRSAHTAIRRWRASCAASARARRRPPRRPTTKASTSTKSPQSQRRRRNEPTQHTQRAR